MPILGASASVVHMLGYMLRESGSTWPLPILNSVLIHSHYKCGVHFYSALDTLLGTIGTEINKTLQDPCQEAGKGHT